MHPQCVFISALIFYVGFSVCGPTDPMTAVTNLLILTAREYRQRTQQSKLTGSLAREEKEVGDKQVRVGTSIEDADADLGELEKRTELVREIENKDAELGNKINSVKAEISTVYQEFDPKLKRLKDINEELKKMNGKVSKDDPNFVKLNNEAQQLIAEAKNITSTVDTQLDGLEDEVEGFGSTLDIITKKLLMNDKRTQLEEQPTRLQQQKLKEGNTSVSDLNQIPLDPHTGKPQNTTNQAQTVGQSNPTNLDEVNRLAENASKLEVLGEEKRRIQAELAKTKKTNDQRSQQIAGVTEDLKKLEKDRKLVEAELNSLTNPRQNSRDQKKLQT